MTLGRFSIQFVFAFVVAALGLTAAASVYREWRKPSLQPAASRALSESRQPDGRQSDNHFPSESAERMLAMRRLIAEHPQDPDYRAQMANLYYDLGEFGKAAEYYQQSLDIRPQDPRIETDLATCFHYLGRSDKALEILDKVLGYHPNFPQAMFNKGLILINWKNDIRGAIRVWEDLLRLDPDFAQKEELEQRILQLEEALQ